MGTDTSWGTTYLCGVIFLVACTALIGVRRSFEIAWRNHALRPWTLQVFGILLMVLGAGFLVAEFIMALLNIPLEEVFGRDVAGYSGLLSVASALLFVGGLRLLSGNMYLARRRHHTQHSHYPEPKRSSKAASTHQSGCYCTTDHSPAASMRCHGSDPVPGTILALTHSGEYLRTSTKYDSLAPPPGASKHSSPNHSPIIRAHPNRKPLIRPSLNHQWAFGAEKALPMPREMALVLGGLLVVISCLLMLTYMETLLGTVRDIAGSGNPFLWIRRNSEEFIAMHLLCLFVLLPAGLGASLIWRHKNRRTDSDPPRKLLHLVWPGSRHSMRVGHHHRRK